MLLRLDWVKLIWTRLVIHMIFVCIFFIAVVILSAFVTYFYFTYYNNKYWKRRGIPGRKPKSFFGDSKDYGPGLSFSHDYIKKIYDTYSDKSIVGLFYLGTPILFVKDLTLIEDVLVKNFKKFSYRRSILSIPFLNPMSENLFQVRNPTWKLLRRNLSPVFTSAKLKQIFDKMSKCSDNYIEALKIKTEKNEPIEICAFNGKLSTDILALSLFSINSNTLLNENSDFQRIASRTPSDNNIVVTIVNIIIVVCYQFIREILAFFRVYDLKDQFLIKVIKNCMESRKKSGLKFNDFLDILINLKSHPDLLDRKKISDNLLLAQALSFVNAGNQPMSLTISHALYELALNPQIQDKLRKEISQVSDENAGKLDYYSIKNMQYLDKIVKETLRKYPIASVLVRTAEDEHTFLNTNISVPKDCIVTIPVYAIHHDKKIYPEPKRFNPNRFDEDVSKLRPKMSYLPFGDGPRMCIGQRFALNQIKLCVAIAVKNFKFEICEQTFKVYKKVISSVFLAPDGGITLNVKKI